MRSDDVLKLSLGIVTRLHVCNVPILVASKFNAHTIRVHLSRQSLQHIAEGHPDIFPSDILQLPSAIRTGQIFFDKLRPRHLTAVRPHPAREKRWLMAGMKFSLATHELWIQTFHLGQRRHLRRLEEEAELIGK